MQKKALVVLIAKKSCFSKKSLLYKAEPGRQNGPMEDVMMDMMMMIRSEENSREHSFPVPSTITTSICPAWKLYENPFYISSQNQQILDHDRHLKLNQEQKQIHHLHLPVSARKIAASFWDLTFIKPLMESELEKARAQIIELKAEIECQRRARKRMESLNKRLARELSEERKSREALERVCEELAKEISSDKAEINRMKKDMEEEKKMLRVAEVIREERVQMKLTEARMMLEEKMLELEECRKLKIESSGSSKEAETGQESHVQLAITSSKVNVADDHDSFGGDKLRFVLAEKTTDCSSNNDGNVHCMTIQRRASPDPENPHIKRGIKGFVEFPKVVRAIGCRSKHLGTKLECQKAQLNILLKQKGPVGFNGLITS